MHTGVLLSVQKLPNELMRSVLPRNLPAKEYEIWSTRNGWGMTALVPWIWERDELQSGAALAELAKTERRLYFDMQRASFERRELS